MTVERWTDDMLDRLAGVVSEQSRTMAGLQSAVSDLREGQALLMQIFNEDRDRALQFRQDTRDALSRFDTMQASMVASQERQERILDYLMQQRG